MLLSTLRDAPAPERDSDKDRAGAAPPLYFNSLGIFGRVFRMVRRGSDVVRCRTALDEQVVLPTGAALHWTVPHLV